MKIAIYGATGNIGRRILAEALNRGHQVTAVVRDTGKLVAQPKSLEVVQGDILNADDVRTKIEGHDLVISAYGPGSGDTGKLVDATRALLKGVKASGTQRLIAVGGAGCLEVAPGLLLIDTPQFPSSLLGIAGAHKQALELYKQEKEIRWTFVSPAAIIQPGERTGSFRLGGNQLLTDREGNSTISMEDYAVALLDEAEKGTHIRQQITVAY